MSVKVKVIQYVPGTKAVYGVIGYIWNSGQPNHLKLTLEGDKDYYGNPAGEPRSIQNKYKVYIALFQFGSLIATTSQNKGNFTTADIVAWPTDWAATSDYRTDRAAMEAKFAGATAGPQAWSVIPKVDDFYNSTNGNAFPTGKTTFPSPPKYPAIRAEALDDPCPYYFGGFWKTPSADEMNLWSDDPGYSWSLPGTPPETNPGFGVFPQTPVSLPATGSRVANTIVAQGITGNYWSASVGNSGQGMFLRFDDSNYHLANTYTNFYVAKAIRCVQ